MPHNYLSYSTESIEERAILHESEAEPPNQNLCPGRVNTKVSRPSGWSQTLAYF